MKQVTTTCCRYQVAYLETVFTTGQRCFFLLLQKSHLHENRAVLCRLTYAGRVGADYKLMIIP